MELEEMRGLWASQEERLERSIQLNERLLHAATHDRVRPALSRYVFVRALSLTFDAVLLLLLGSFLVDHIEAPRFLIPALILQVFVIGTAASSAYRITRAVQLDFSGPVVELQRSIEHMKLIEYRTLKWVVLGSILIWVPMIIVPLQGFWGIDFYAAVSPAWVVANLALGIVVIAIGQWLSLRYVERPDAGPWARRLVDGLADRKLRRVSRFLDELSRFARDAQSE